MPPTDAPWLDKQSPNRKGAEEGRKGLVGCALVLVRFCQTVYPEDGGGGSLSLILLILAAGTT